VTAGPVAAVAAGGPAVVALPGERLSKAPGTLSEADLAAAEVFTLDDLDAEGTDAASTGEAGPIGTESDEATRRRRRRGGRGRGRGRGRGEGELAQPSGGNGAASRPVSAEEDAQEDEIDAIASAPQAPRTTPFGSVWDSQLGTPTPPASGPFTPLTDEDDLDEPEIPEYLIAEQRRGAAMRSGQGGNRGPRGGRAAYQSAIARERYGSGGGGGGINRYPDVSGRTAPRVDRSYDRGDRGDRGGTPIDRTPAPRRGSGEWSEVPPELEAQLRAQVANRPPAAAPAPEPADVEPTSSETVEVAPAATGRRTTRKPSAASTKATAKSATATDEAAAAPKRKTTRKTAASAASPDSDSPASADADGTAAAPKRKTTRKTTTGSAAADGDTAAEGTAAAAPKRRTTRKPASS
jgi:hypothetical protein